MKYFFEANKDDECIARTECSSECYIRDKYTIVACVGLGQPGCPFQPIQEESCETCGHRQKKPRWTFGRDMWPCSKFNRLITLDFGCSAYTPEVK